MKAKHILFAAALAGVFVPSAAKSAKRGVSENEFQYKAQMEALAPAVSWYYTWGNSMNSNLSDATDMEFVPMCWNASYNADKIREYVKNHPEVKYLLGFNEPNFTNQADMTPAEAAEAWPSVQALAKELGLKLVAPALNYSPNPPYQSPTKWMDEFVALVGNDAFDYLAVHAYGGVGVTKEICTTFHEKYGKDVWLTEFCLWPDEGNPNAVVSPTSQISTMMQLVEWLEKTEWIHRYAWFKAIGSSSSEKGPNFGLLLSGKGETPRELSTQGLVYTTLPDFNPEDYHAINTTVPAMSYDGQTSCIAGKGSDPENPLPVEIVSFNAGATLDYRFDVPEADEYTLVIRVSGIGEPTRFNPSIDICTVESDGTDGTILASKTDIALPNSDTSYQTVNFALNLPAGKHVLRIKDANASRPSGIHISTVELADSSHVESLDGILADGNTTVDVYSLQGMLLRRGVETTEALSGLPAGIYIVGGKKVINN